MTIDNIGRKVEESSSPHQINQLRPNKTREMRASWHARNDMYRWSKPHGKETGTKVSKGGNPSNPEERQKPQKLLYHADLCIAESLISTNVNTCCQPSTWFGSFCCFRCTLFYIICSHLLKTWSLQWNLHTGKPKWLHF